MFLILSKVLDLLLAPLTWALLLGAAALVLHRRARLARALLGAALALLYASSTAGVANALMRRVEAGAARTWRPETVYDAVIVLGGGLSPGATEAAGTPQFNEAPERVMRGFELVRSGQARHVLLSGGSLDPRPDAVVEAEVLARVLEGWGVPRERLHVEGRSRNTRENALLSAEVVRARGWSRLLLVTSAAHMPRAVACFRAVGLAPDTLPVDYRAGSAEAGGGWLPRASHLDMSTDALRELAGRLVYRLQGYAR